MTLETTGNRPRVVVVGAGFAGLYTVRGLKKSGYRVTLIDKHLYSTFQPLLYQVATGGLNPGDVSYTVGGYARRYHARYVRGELAAIDPGQRQITLGDGRQLGYDYLVLATGVASSHFGIKGAAEYTYGLYTRHDALTLRDRFMADVERLSEGAQMPSWPSPWSAAAPPAWSWPAPWPSCATVCCATRSPMSTRPASTSAWSR